MKLGLKAGLFILSIAINLPPAVADGLTSHGHISGPHTALRLSPAQIEALRHGTAIELTPFQKKLMLQATGVSGVERLYVFPRSVETCTCELANVAIRTSRTSVEVADFLFGCVPESEDSLMSRWQKRYHEQADAEKAEGEMKEPPEQVKLHLMARKLQAAGKDREAIPLLQQAIKIDPNYKWARRDLAAIYRSMAGDYLGPAVKLEAKLSLCKQALAVLDADDQLLSHSIQQDADRIQARLDACRN
jgi:hypothetical protein